MSRPGSFGDALPHIRRILRHVRPYLVKERSLIAGSTALVLLDVGFRLLEPWPLKVVFDRLTLPVSQTPGLSVPFADRLDVSSLLAWAALLVVVFAALRAAAAYGSTVGFALAGNRVLTSLRNDLYAKLQRLSLSYHARAKSGDLVIRLIGDVGLLKDVAVTALLPLVANVLVLIGMFAVMLWLHWQLAALALTVVPLFWLSTAHIGRRIHDVSRAQRRREGDMAGHAAESIVGIKTIQALSLEPVFGRFFVAQSGKTLTQGIKAKRLEARLERTVDLLVAGATALVLWYGAVLVLRQRITPGDLILFLSYLRSAYKPVRDFAKYTGRLAKATAAGERVVDLLEQTPDVIDRPGAIAAPAFRGALGFDRVSFAYDSTRHALADISFDVPPGTRLAIVGPSGAGKSTLVNLILRLYDPTEGRVLIDGHDISSYRLESLRGQIAVVLQDAVVFAASVGDNIAYGAPGATREDIEAAAVLANAHEFISALPKGYDTVLGERGLTLSTGQRQRIAIARAAIRNAPLLVLDEPGAALDKENERAVLTALARVAAGRTTVLVTHELWLAAEADLILYLEHGRVLEQGTHDTLMTLDRRYAASYRVQQSRRTADAAQSSYAGTR